MADILDIDRRIDKQNEEYLRLKKGNIPKEVLNSSYRVKALYGIVPHKEKGKFTGEYSRRYDKSRYKFFLDAPFEITDKCCDVMKKKPAKMYVKQTGRYPIIATMAEESEQRKSHWLQEGCNVFESKNPKSKPMSFWTEQDVLRYIKEYNIKIASVYGDIVPDYGEDQCEGQMSIEDFGLIPDQRKLKTTGCKRTGCMFCGFGCHLNNDQRFVLMKTTHPKQYEYIMKPKDQGGLGYKEIIDWINEHGDLNIKY